MEENNYIALLYQQLAGSINSGEKAQLTAWLAQSEEHQDIAEAVEQAWLLGANYQAKVTVDLDADFALLQKRISAAQVSPVVPLASKTQSAAKVRPLLSKLQIAASVLILVAAGFLLQQYFKKGEAWQNVVAETATKEAILLADGTKVWVNAGSTFSYPEKMEGEERRVKLQGEAYFDVARDEAHPFIIETPTSSVQVLGTSFNVRDFQQEETMQVDVISGKVRVAIAGSNAAVDLVKNQQAVYNRSAKTLVTKNSEGQNSAAWATRQLHFSNNTLANALQQIGRLYQVQLTLQNPALANCPLSGDFNQSDIKPLLDNLALVYGISVEEQGNRQFVLKGGVCPEAKRATE